jgi:hypothetical protein
MGNRGIRGRTAECRTRRINKYKSLCCDVEIVIPAGVTFPDCAARIRLTTYRQLCVEIVGFISQSNVGIATGEVR